MVNQFSAQESTRTALFTTTVNTLCQLLPVEEIDECVANVNCTFTFGTLSSLGAGFQLLETLDNLKTKAFVGVAGNFYDASLGELVAGILAAQAEQLSFWRTVLAHNPSPDYVVTGYTENQALCAAVAYISNPTTCVPFSTLVC